VSLQLLLERLDEVKQSGSGWSARCPSHDDAHASLSVGLGDDGRVLVHCHAGCPAERVVEAIGMTMAMLMAPSSHTWHSDRTPRLYESLDIAVGAIAGACGGSVEALHDYRHADGTIAFYVVRLRTASGKTYRPISPAGTGWRIGAPQGALPLFNLPSINETQEIVVTEGEKCALVAIMLGTKATTSAHGAQSARKTDWTPLAGKHVVLLPDKDEAGLKYVFEVASILRGLTPPASARMLALPDLPAGGDIVDWYEAKRAAGLDDAEVAEELAKLLEQAEPIPDSAHSAHSARGGATAKWDPPLPVVSPVVLPPFPIETAFPSYLRRLRDFAVAVAETYQVPVDAVVMCILPVMALTLAKRFEVEPMPGWREQLSTYSVVLLPSGDRKTAVIRCLLSPVYAWQRDKATGLDVAVARCENEIFALEEKLKAARKKHAEGEEPADDQDELARHLRELERTRPQAPRLIATEGTSEAIALMLVENNERGMVAAAEGDALDVMLGRYSGSPNFGVWLSGHSGDAVDSVRRGRKADRLAHPALQVVLCIQPQAVFELIASRAAQGRGLLARIFFVMPESKVGFRKLTPPPIPTDLSDFYGTRVQSHLSQDIPTEPTLIRLTPEASAILLEFRAQNEIDLRPEGALELFKDWGSKLPGNLVRIAGTFAAFAHPENPVIDAETMRCALTLASYLTNHYEYVISMAGDDKRIAVARRIDSWIRRNRIAVFSRRDAFTAVRSAQIQNVEDLDPALELLQARHRIRPLLQVTRHGPGRPASPQFAVNPLVHQGGNGPSSTNTPNARDRGEGSSPPESGAQAAGQPHATPPDQLEEGGAPQNTHNTQNSTQDPAPPDGKRPRQRGGEGDEWYTPPEIVVAARSVLGEIDLDPASNHIAQQWIRAKQYYTKEIDGLRQPWRGRVFANPPYSYPLIAQNVAKLLYEISVGNTTEAILLVNSQTSAQWFQNAYRAASSICLPAGRIRFLRPSGEPGQSPKQGQAILYFGPNSDRFEQHFKAFGNVTTIRRRGAA